MCKDILCIIVEAEDRKQSKCPLSHRELVEYWGSGYGKICSWNYTGRETGSQRAGGKGGAGAQQAEGRQRAVLFLRKDKLLRRRRKERRRVRSTGDRGDTPWRNNGKSTEQWWGHAYSWGQGEWTAGVHCVAGRTSGSNTGSESNSAGVKRPLTDPSPEDENKE